MGRRVRGPDQAALVAMLTRAISICAARPGGMSRSGAAASVASRSVSVGVTITLDTDGSQTRPVLFDSDHGFVDARIIDRATLAQGDTVRGPAIITQLDSTVIVAPGEVATVAVRRTILTERKATT